MLKTLIWAAIMFALFPIWMTLTQNVTYEGTGHAIVVLICMTTISGAMLGAFIRYNIIDEERNAKEKDAI